MPSQRRVGSVRLSYSPCARSSPSRAATAEAIEARAAEERRLREAEFKAAEAHMMAMSQVSVMMDKSNILCTSYYKSCSLTFTAGSTCCAPR